jgi:hypothetical protein
MAAHKKEPLGRVEPSTESLKACRKGVKSIRVAGEFLALGKTVVRELIRDEKLRCFKVRGKNVIPVADLVRFLAERMDEQLN